VPAAIDARVHRENHAASAVALRIRVRPVPQMRTTHCVSLPRIYKLPEVACLLP
jgi:hypothetical protein